MDKHPPIPLHVRTDAFVLRTHGRVHAWACVFTGYARRTFNHNYQICHSVTPLEIPANDTDVEAWRVAEQA